MALSTALVNIVIGLRNHASTGLAYLSRSLVQLGRTAASSMAKMTAGLAKWGSIAGVGAVATGAYQSIAAFAELEDAQRALQALLMKSSGEVPAIFKPLNSVIERLGTDLPGTTTDFYNLAIAMKRAGIDGEMMVGGALEAAAKLAVVLKKPYEEIGESMGKMSKALTVADSDMVKFADTLQRSINMGPELGQLSEVFSKVAGPLSSKGLGGLKVAEQMTAIASIPLSKGLDASSVGTGMGNLISILANRTQMDKFNKRSKIKLNTATKDSLLNGGLENLIAELSKLKSLGGGLTDKLEGLFGKGETADLAGVLVNAGMDGYREQVRRMKEQAGLEQRNTHMMKSLLNVWDSAQGTFTSLLATIGSMFEPELKDLAATFGSVSDGAKKWLEDNRAMIRSKILGIAESIKSGFGKLPSLFQQGAEAFGKLLGFVDGVSKYFGDMAEAYNLAHPDTKSLLKSMNPLDFFPALIELNDIRAGVTAARESQEQITLQKQQKASWLSATKGSVFDSTPSLLDALKSLKESQPERKDKLIIELDASGFPRVKSFEQGKGPLRDIELRTLTGQSMPLSGAR